MHVHSLVDDFPLSTHQTFARAAYQAALPRAMFAVLTSYLGVEHECYASPLNCCLPSYCSVFEDTDRYFGAKGNFVRACGRHPLLWMLPTNQGVEGNGIFFELNVAGDAEVPWARYK